MSIVRRFLAFSTTAIVLVTVSIGTYFMLRDQFASIIKEEPEYRIGIVERGNLRETVSVTGSVEAHRRSDLSFLMAGRVGLVNVKVGQRVQVGDVLMSLDTAEYEFDLLDAQIAVELQRIAFEQLLAGPSRADIAAAGAAVQRAQAQLDQITQPPSEETVRIAQANLELRRSDLWLALVERDRILHDSGHGYELDLANKRVETAQLAVRIAEQELFNAQQGVSSYDIAIMQASVRQAQATLYRLLEGPNEIDTQLANLQIEQAELALESARAALVNAELVAPFDGIVAEIHYDVGEQVTPGLTAIVILDDSSFHIDALVDEIDIARIEGGQLAFIGLDAWPGADVSGHVMRIAPDAINVGGIISYEVRILIDTSNVIIRDGMTTTVDIVVSELMDVLLVPNWAIRFDRTTGQAYVNVRRGDGTVEEVLVTIGVRGATMSEVRQGLREGDIVVVSLVREEIDVFDRGQE